MKQWISYIFTLLFIVSYVYAGGYDDRSSIFFLPTAYQIPRNYQIKTYDFLYYTIEKKVAPFVSVGINTTLPMEVGGFTGIFMKSTLKISSHVAVGTLMQMGTAYEYSIGESSGTVRPIALFSPILTFGWRSLFISFGMFTYGVFRADQWDLITVAAGGVNTRITRTTQLALELYIPLYSQQEMPLEWLVIYGFRFAAGRKFFASLSLALPMVTDPDFFVDVSPLGAPLLILGMNL